LFKTRYTSALAVDNDFNVYTVTTDLHTLQKWPPGAAKPINLFEGRFPISPLFYHSLSRSLYFFYVIQNNPSVYKLVDDSSTPVNAINVKGQGVDLDQLGTTCTGLYVNSAGDIFVLDKIFNRVVKWAVNATSGILVADGTVVGSNRWSYVTALYVDEINDALYVLDQNSGNRILKYANGSTNGMVAFGGGPKKFFSDVIAEYMSPLSVLVDKMGNVLVGELSKITKWTSDIQSSVMITGQDKQGHSNVEPSISSPNLMIFDKLENLYVFDGGYAQVIRFNRTFTLCMNNIH
jgi:hypothetical protein